MKKVLKITLMVIVLVLLTACNPKDAVNEVTDKATSAVETATEIKDLGEGKIDQAKDLKEMTKALQSFAKKPRVIAIETPTYSRDALAFLVRETPLEEPAKIIYDISVTNQVDPIFLLTVAIHETDNGQSLMVKEHKNLFAQFELGTPEFKSEEEQKFVQEPILKSFNSYEESVQEIVSEIVLGTYGSEHTFESTTVLSFTKKHSVDPVFDKQIERLATHLVPAF